MDYHSLHIKTVAELRAIAKAAKLKIPAGTNKSALVMLLLEHQAAEGQSAAAEAQKSAAKAPESAAAAPAEQGGKAAQTPAGLPAESSRPARSEASAEQGEKAAQSAAGLPVRPEASPEEGFRRRPLSTQQRMGARSQPQPGACRPQGNRLHRFEGSLQRQYAARRSETMQESAGALPQGAEALQRPQRMPLQHPESTQLPEASPEREVRPAEGSLNPGATELLQSGECGEGAGVMEIHADGYGFLRAENYLPGNRDVYVSAAQIRRFNLRTGDYVTGKTRPQPMADRSVGLIYVNSVNGQHPEAARRRRFFDALVPVYPDERLPMERPGTKDVSLRLIDLIAPIGKGQRGLIVSPPKAGKTTLLKKIAASITANNPDVHLIVLLIDERPEEVTDMKRSIEGEVVYSTFDEAPENHTRVSEMVLERAQRLVELGKDVVILLDSITRLARAYNLVIPPTGRSLSGGLDPGALHKPKRFFGAARNIENGGSLTIIATALVDTGSRMDDIIYEEFKGTGNMELHLDRSLSDRRIFPAIDLHRSGTRREELLLSPDELDAALQARRMLSRGNPQEAAEQLISMMQKSADGKDFAQRMRSWRTVCEKDGFC